MDGVQGTNNPSGIDPSEMYDGPKPGNVTQFPQTVSGMAPVRDQPVLVGPSLLFADQQPPEPIDRTGVLKIIFEVLAIRVLGLIAVITACLLWGVAVYWPDLSRTVTALGFSVTVLGPICALYWRRHPPEV